MAPGARGEGERENDMEETQDKTREHKVNVIGLMVAFLFWMEALRIFG